MCIRDRYYVFVQTDKKAAADDEQSEKENKKQETKSTVKTFNFEKVEVLKGVSDMGYTAVIFVHEIPKNAKIVVKGAFFVNAKLSNTGGHDH